MSTLATELLTRRQPLYDSRTIAAIGGALKYDFFKGATANAFGYATNLTTDGQLPDPESFELFSPRIVPAFAATVPNQQAVVSCFTEIKFNSRDFFGGPGWLMPAAAGIAGFDATGVVASHGVPHPSAIMSLSDDSLLVEPRMSFNQSFDFAAPASLPAAAVLTHVVWDGLHTRAAQ